MARVQAHFVNSRGPCNRLAYILVWLPFGHTHRLTSTSSPLLRNRIIFSLYTNAIDLSFFQVRGKSFLQDMRNMSTRRWNGIHRYRISFFRGGGGNFSEINLPELISVLTLYIRCEIFLHHFPRKIAKVKRYSLLAALKQECEIFVV